jgi:hypothetical protein
VAIQRGARRLPRSADEEIDESPKMWRPKQAPLRAARQEDTPPMYDYRLYLMTKDGLVCGVEDFRSDGDESAMQEAETIRRGATAELWTKKRRLKVYRQEQP